ncbi:hypothetical protein K501DRAFT_278436 [Backusella circina FSU 941]|nr:hypothetical protein K501DRAFT_278436 [Backusella circina FSU 941]
MTSVRQNLRTQNGLSVKTSSACTAVVSSACIKSLCGTNGGKGIRGGRDDSGGRDGRGGRGGKGGKGGRGGSGGGGNSRFFIVILFELGESIGSTLIVIYENRPILKYTVFVSGGQVSKSKALYRSREYVHIHK